MVVMATAVRVHSVVLTEPDLWRIDGPQIGDLDRFVEENRHRALEVSTTRPNTQPPTFPGIEGVDGALVVCVDEAATPGLGFWAHLHTEAMPLGGAGDGFMLVAPPVATTFDDRELRNIDGPKPRTWPFRHDGIDTGIFRVAPFESNLLCGEWAMDGDERIIDIARTSEMEFPDWIELTGATGLTLSEVWRHDFESTT